MFMRSCFKNCRPAGKARAQFNRHFFNTVKAFAAREPSATVFVPMSFQAQIDQDLKEAMKAKQAERLGVIRMLKSALKNLAIEKGGIDFVLDDATALGVVRKELKKRQDSIEGFEKGNRPDLAAKEKAEAEILAVYLPQPFTPEEIAALVKNAIAEVGATSKAQMGAVMKVATERAAGRADGKVLSTAVNAALS
jgi:uncharacterized protein YqeY